MVNAYDGYDLMVNFNYQGTYNVNDSIDVYIQSAKVWVKETGIVYEKAFRLLDQNEDYTLLRVKLLRLIKVSLN